MARRKRVEAASDLALDELIPERLLLDAVVEAARALGWLVHHDRPARDRRGKWATAIQGDAGFPDLVLVRPPRVLFVELKAERGTLTVAQQGWLEAVSGCPGVECYVWRPRDWLDGTVLRVLGGQEVLR